MKLLISDAQSLKKVVPVNADLTFSEIEPYIHSAQLFVARFTGELLIANLADVVANGNELNAQQQALLDRLARPVGNLAGLKYANVKTGQLTDTGVMRTAGAGQADAFEWQVERMASQLNAEAWDGLEDLLRFLEDKKEDYPDYLASDQYQYQSGLLIKDAQTFSKHYFIADSRLTYWSLQSCLVKAEDRVKRLLGSRFNYLSSGGELSTNQKEQLRLAQDAIAYLTMVRAVQERIVNITDQGVQVNSIANYIRQQRPASTEQIKMMLEYLNTQVSETLADLSELLPPPTDPPKSNGGVRGDAIVSFF
ncbi:DUF6712 family protein [Larkinella insperata]|uniref:DUF6712 family protein n=1 Tax=Larkinella insperata TaxID=332158 RepID=A0ABW3QH49_9BACT|nr:DUF6712 family protein [Larkinella insperata]